MWTTDARGAGIGSAQEEAEPALAPLDELDPEPDDEEPGEEPEELVDDVEEPFEPLLAADELESGLLASDFPESDLLLSDLPESALFSDFSDFSALTFPARESLR